MTDVFLLQMWDVRSSVYEQRNPLKFSTLALGLPVWLNWISKKTSRSGFSVSSWRAYM